MRVTIALLLIAATVAGCSADIERHAASGALARADATTRDVGSVRLRTTLRAHVGGVRTDASGWGAIDFRAGRVAVTMTGKVGERYLTWESISEEHALYSRTVGDPTSWTVVRSKKPGGPVYERAMVGARDPAAQLMLMALIKNVGRIGTEKVDGVMTTRYGGEVEVPGYQIEPVDFWVDDQWRIRRLRTLTISTDGRQIATTEFYDYGARIEPIVPPKVG